jgi:Zn ribbon nucleic-acid-binding protein
MKTRTGKECKHSLCKNYDKYSRWMNNLGSASLKECMNCKHAYVSQYQVKQEGNRDGRYK